MTTPLKVLSLFDGVGGFDLGFERAGMEIIGQAESDPKARSVLERHWPDVNLHTDVHDITASDYPDVDVLCGGFPCQDISVAGKQKGIARGDKSVLWWEFYRIIHDLRPRWVVIENVANLLNINGGRDLGAIIGSLDELGYMGEWRILDSQGFGVPQRRRRVFLVGHLGGGGGPAVLLEPEGSAGSVPARSEERRPAASTDQGMAGLDGQVVGIHLTQTPVFGDPSPTLGASARLGAWVDGRVRFYTPKECERLQGFPDDWTLHAADGGRIADTHRYRFMGNAVTVNVVEWIGRRLVAADEEISNNLSTYP